MCIALNTISINHLYLSFSSTSKKPPTTLIYTKSSIYCTPKLLSKSPIHVKAHLNAIAVCLMGTFRVTATMFHDASDVKKNTGTLLLITAYLLAYNNQLYLVV